MAAGDGEELAEFSQAVLTRLKTAEKKAAAARQRVGSLVTANTVATRDFNEATERYESALSELARAKRDERSAELAAAQAIEAEKLRTQLGQLEEEIATLKAGLQALINTHEALIKDSAVFIEERKNAIIDAFETYASSFMVEECRLRYRPNYRARVAQTDDKIDWPAFEVDLASGADAAPTERKHANEVSESQKEFIDLAFRMALLSVAADGEPSMLAVETPEASLDAFFVEKAGNLLRSYANSREGNVLLVSSNLTREEMIARLLGTRDGLEDVDRRRARTLNLLEYARPTKAYRLNKAFYDAKYDEAVGAQPPVLELVE